jgi:hypothetical protein
LQAASLIYLLFGEDEYLLAGGPSKDALAANRHVCMTGHNDGFWWRTAAAC